MDVQRQIPVDMGGMGEVEVMDTETDSEDGDEDEEVEVEMVTTTHYNEYIPDAVRLSLIEVEA